MSDEPEQIPEDTQQIVENYDLSKLPCCGAHVFKLREVASAQWYCHKCGKDIPQPFIDQMVAKDPNFQNVLTEAIRTANQSTPDVEVVLQKKIPPPPDDPRYKQQQSKIDAFRAGMKTSKDKFALCPYVEGTSMYTEWYRGREFAAEVIHKVKK